MTAPPEPLALNDPGLIALVMLLRFHGIGADPAQIRHQCGTDAIGVADMICCAKAFGLKARELKSSWARLASTPLPAIAVLITGQPLAIASTWTSPNASLRALLGNQ